MILSPLVEQLKNFAVAFPTIFDGCIRLVIDVPIRMVAGGSVGLSEGEDSDWAVNGLTFLKERQSRVLSLLGSRIRLCLNLSWQPGFITKSDALAIVKVLRGGLAWSFALKNDIDLESPSEKLQIGESSDR